MLSLKHFLLAILFALPLAGCAPEETDELGYEEEIYEGGGEESVEGVYEDEGAVSAYSGAEEEEEARY